MKSRNKKSFIISDTINRIATNEQDRELLKRFFAGAVNRPPEFYSLVKKVVTEVTEQAALLDDNEAVWLFALDGSGSLCLAGPALATQRICEKSHRLATLEEIGDRRRRKPV